MTTVKKTGCLCN